MQLYYGLLGENIVALTYAENEDQALDQIELGLAEEGVLNTAGIEITRFPKSTGTIVLVLGLED